MVFAMSRLQISLHRQSTLEHCEVTIRKFWKRTMKIEFKHKTNVDINSCRRRKSLWKRYGQERWWINRTENRVNLPCEWKIVAQRLVWNVLTVWNRCTLVNRLFGTCKQRSGYHSIGFVCSNVHVAISQSSNKLHGAYCVGTVWLIFVAVTANNANTRIISCTPHTHMYYHVPSATFCGIVFRYWWYDGM